MTLLFEIILFRIVSSFEVIAENLVGQENFSNITVGTSRVALSGLRVNRYNFTQFLD